MPIQHPIASALPRLLRGTVELLFPPTCILCGAPGDGDLDLCAGCRHDLPAIAPCCTRCALPLPKELSGSRSLALCGACQRHPPPFAHCHAAFRYQDPLPSMIAGLKFRGRLNVLRLTGLLLAASLRASGAELPEAIVPVPLHRKRLRKRGYNQALELARIVGRELALPVDDLCCERMIATRPQAELEQKARHKNLRGAFRATVDMQDRHVAILDDVVTTASTVSELTRVLQRAGCQRVDVWTVARTP
jgi:ComF family protein